MHKASKQPTSFAPNIKPRDMSSHKDVVPTAQSPEVIISMSPLYHIFFLYLEPFSTIAGAFCAYMLPKTYLELTHAPSAPGVEVLVLPTSTIVVLAQLANLYFLFALNEGLVLRSTRDVRVWRTLLLGLLIADFGHLFSVYELGVHKYWQVWGWNSMDMGNIGFVYLGALMRLSFLCSIGVTTANGKVKRG